MPLCTHNPVHSVHPRAACQPSPRHSRHDLTATHQAVHTAKPEASAVVFEGHNAHARVPWLGATVPGWHLLQNPAGLAVYPIGHTSQGIFLPVLTSLQGTTRGWRRKMHGTPGVCACPEGLIMLRGWHSTPCPVAPPCWHSPGHEACPPVADSALSHARSRGIGARPAGIAKAWSAFRAAG